jgi:hypothetical protein
VDRVHFAKLVVAQLAKKPQQFCERRRCPQKKVRFVKLVVTELVKKSLQLGAKRRFITTPVTRHNLNQVNYDPYPNPISI